MPRRNEHFGAWRGSIPDSLRSSLDATGALVKFGFPFWLRLFLDRRVVAITLGRRIFLAADASEWGAERLASILRHEVAHVDQVLRLGLVRFLVAYVAEYLRGRRGGLDHHSAYEAISFEREARRLESEPGESDRGARVDI